MKILLLSALTISMIFCFIGDEHFAEGARGCDLTHPHEWIMKSYEPRICERVNYFVHPDCGKIEGLYLTDSRCQPPPGFPFERLSTTGSFIELKMDKTIFKMGETISISGNSYTTVGLPDEDIGIRVFNSEGTKIIDFKSKIIRTGNDFQFKIETGNPLSINVEDDYQLRVVNSGKYGSEIFQKFTVSNDGLPLPIKPESIPITPTTNTPESSNQIMVQVSEPSSSGINWTMIGVFVIVGIIIVAIIFKKIRSLGISSNDDKYEEDYEEDFNDPNDPLHPTRDDVKNKFKRYSPGELEKLVGKVFRAQGYKGELQGNVNASDGGIDLKMSKDGMVTFIQVKHQAGSGDTVKSSKVRDLYGASNNVANKAILITTSKFTKDGIEFANHPTRKNFLELWSLERFQDEVVRHLIQKEYSDVHDDFQKKQYSHYEVLGVSKNSSQDEIKDAFRRLSLKLHPDKETSSLSESNMMQINAAYEVLSDPEKRNAYDQTL